MPPLSRRAALASGLAAATLPRLARAQAAPALTVDVVVLGAGLSGLTTARRLKARGFSVAVLEGRDRVGGRNFYQPVGSHRFELGGQFIGPTQDHAKALIAELGLQLKPTFVSAQKIWELQDRKIAFTGAIPPLSWPALLDLQHMMGKIDDLASSVGALAPWSAPGAAALDSLTLAQWTSKYAYTQTATDLLTCSARAIYGADPDEISALYAAFYTAQGDSIEMLTNSNDGAQDSVIVGGSQQMSQRLAAMLGDIVHTSQAASLIQQNESGVRVTTQAGMVVQAKYAVLAMPPAAAGQIDFDPPLPPARRDLQQRAPMGHYYKVIVTYDRPFWREAGFSGEVASVRGPIIAAYDDITGDETGAILGFIGGDAAMEWEALPGPEQRQSVLDCLTRWFGPRAQNATGYGFHDWGAERLNGYGCPVTVLPPGVLSKLGPALRDPCGRLHFAGTEAATKWTGYMDGALRAGEAAAEQVAGRLA